MAVRGFGDEVLAAVREWTEELIAEKLMPVLEALESLSGFSALLGDGTAKEFTVTHGLGTSQVMISLWGVNGSSVPRYTVETSDAESVKVTFSETPDASGVRINIVPVRNMA